jgi:hypothetical protein
LIHHSTVQSRNSSTHHAGQLHKKKLPYSRLIRPYRPLIMEILMEGKDIEHVFEDIIFEPIDD